MSRLIINERLEFGKYIIELKAWEIREKEYKYSFVLIKNEERILGFDNHENKEPHIHTKDEEIKYDFTTIHQAVQDFWEMAGRNDRK